MLTVLGNRTYRHLFLAQILSLIGTGLTTVALGLLAYDLAGDRAGQVLGTALAIKMVAYVGLAPVAAALAAKVPRRRFLVTLDLCRAGMVLMLPFVTAVWQVYLLVFLFQACSASFTPTFQATIPDILTSEKDYTNALSLSRLAYDLESLISPMLAALLLAALSFHWLFVGNAFAFLASAALVVSVVLPAIRAESMVRSFRERLTRGAFIYLRTPRLQGLLALSFAVSSAGSMVIVNTVVFVRDGLGGDDLDVAVLFAAYGVGSMAVALALPRLLDDRPPRGVMLAGAGLLAASLPLGALGLGYGAAMALWAAVGASVSLIMTPSGLLLRRSSHPEDRPALFAAQFALSHACWLVAYPTAGWLGLVIGLPNTFIVLAAGAALGAIAAACLWPAVDPEVIEHDHDGIVHAHGHADDAHHGGGLAEWRADGAHCHQPVRHAHAFVIDDHHPAWPGTRQRRRPARRMPGD
ncbi:MAG: MFS transporter [Alphaproteobacteria bacterium]|nr:MFS transporter [Alphaproteobacteria bacterium]